MIELSRQFPTPEVMERIAQALSIEAYELFAVPPSSENSMEQLRQDIIGEIKQVVGEAIEKAIAKTCSNAGGGPFGF